MKKILFICLGNICRSPMAEYLFRHIAAERNLNVVCASAGTSGWHDGEYMHCGTAEILDCFNIASNDFVSSKVPNDAPKIYDYLIVMDDNNLRDMQQRFGSLSSMQLFKITDLLPENSTYNHVPDPWYTGNFQETRDLLHQCCTRLADKLQNGSM
ncbi:MAG: low molecular weight protein-tyrosine-phosphatase [Alysiella sp.]|uniref:low molecular weight protein-tyrosine-phosphatase n=1 Tax=Alysiella sp. TaxID=1872483 RepID=UPI0026DD1239|nr:low molecular weight protein-tyrosine-phosphatase [Alysiella sp.]MDO4433507.1 low molecular weight protein-tyrosine-phosphatase [Alysiella sp.]